jgi:ABC-type multidrug transport system fused ATPase/permease subunit
MFCTNCGASNKDDAKLCINCGESLSEVQIEENLPQSRGFIKDRSNLKKVDFLQDLFRLSFNQFVSPKIMKFLYGLSILLSGLIALFFVIMGFKISWLFGVFALFLGAPLIFLLMVIYSRVFLEMVLMIFRMADHVAEYPTDTGLANIEENQESKDTIQWNI